MWKLWGWIEPHINIFVSSFWEWNLYADYCFFVTILFNRFWLEHWKWSIHHEFDYRKIHRYSYPTLEFPYILCFMTFCFIFLWHIFKRLFTWSYNQKLQFVTWPRYVICICFWHNNTSFITPLSMFHVSQPNEFLQIDVLKFHYKQKISKHNFTWTLI